VPPTLRAAALLPAREAVAVISCPYCRYLSPGCDFCGQTGWVRIHEWPAADEEEARIYRGGGHFLLPWPGIEEAERRFEGKGP
jgi:hypothetical protein